MKKRTLITIILLIILMGATYAMFHYIGEYGEQNYNKGYEEGYDSCKEGIIYIQDYLQSIIYFDENGTSKYMGFEDLCESLE